MDSVDLEREFRNRANAEVEDGIMARDAGFHFRDEQMIHSNRNINSVNRRNKSTSQFAEACEHFLKAPIIYRDLQKSNLIIGTAENDRDDQIETFLKSPKKIQDSIITGTDPRKGKNLILNTSTGDSRVNGHDIFAYYQLQDPTMASLINHEFLIGNGEDNTDWILFALLTRDIFRDDSIVSTNLPRTMLDSLDKNKASFENFRYSSTHLGENSATRDDSEFLIQMSGGLEHVMSSYYPHVDFDITESRLEHDLGIPFTQLAITTSIKNTLLRLDNISSYYLKNEFNPREFECFLNELSKINSNPILSTEDKLIFRNIYSNLCIYLKHTAMEMDINLLFDEKVFRRINNYCKVVMDSNLFDINATQLKDQSFFIMHKNDLEKELKEKRQNENTIEESFKELNRIGEICKEKDIPLEPIIKSGLSAASLETNIHFLEENNIPLSIISYFNYDWEKIMILSDFCIKNDIDVSNLLDSDIDADTMYLALKGLIDNDIVDIKNLLKFGTIINIIEAMSFLTKNQKPITEKAIIDELTSIEIYNDEELNRLQSTIETDADIKKIRNALMHSRMNFYDSTNPLAKVSGTDSFEGYVGFIYPNGIIVLDNLNSNDFAAYVLNLEDFDEIRKLSRAEIKADSRIKKIIHKGNWQEIIKDIIYDNHIIDDSSNKKR